jgi:hypothetical protein
MISRLMLAAAITMIPVAALADQDDAPHRPAGQIAILDMSVDDAQACLSRELDKNGGIQVLAVDGGADVDWAPPGGMFTKGSDKFFAKFRLREVAGEVSLSVLYRRPLSARSMVGTMHSLSKRCLVVKEMRPEPGQDSAS